MDRVCVGTTDWRIDGLIDESSRSRGCSRKHAQKSVYSSSHTHMISPSPRAAAPHPLHLHTLQTRHFRQASLPHPPPTGTQADLQTNPPSYLASAGPLEHPAHGTAPQNTPCPSPNGEMWPERSCSRVAWPVRNCWINMPAVATIARRPFFNSRSCIFSKASGLLASPSFCCRFSGSNPRSPGAAESALLSAATSMAPIARSS
mmetsp:Transcript_53353/g.134343  ORF Transcript_53353/g.134343 Transcript_53353/m.134343 type:complete len:203 (+) Transcript_53353:981-1589(+)